MTQYSSNNSIVVINQFEYQYDKFNIPALVDSSGTLSKLSNFDTPTGTGSYFSCSFTINGIMVVVGGSEFKAKEITRQISVVDDCGLRRVGDMPHDFSYPACNSFTGNDGIEEALLCFSSYAKSGCYR